MILIFCWNCLCIITCIHTVSLYTYRWGDVIVLCLNVFDGLRSEVWGLSLSVISPSIWQAVCPHSSVLAWLSPAGLVASLAPQLVGRPGQDTTLDIRESPHESSTPPHPNTSDRNNIITSLQQLYPALKMVSLLQY